MSLNIEKEVATMELMTVNELREKFAVVFGEATNGRNKRWLIRRIAWRLQANEFGGLSQRAKDRAAELVNVADVRVTPPKDSRSERATPIPVYHQPEPQSSAPIKASRSRFAS